MSSSAEPAADRSLLDWAVAGRPAPGHAVSGDAHVVAPFAGGALLAVIDGLGHGDEAAIAAEAAIEALRGHAGDPVLVLLDRCHERLRTTRGAVISLASVDVAGRKMEWTGVGNVEGMLRRPDGSRESLLLRGGVVGYRLPPPRASKLGVSPGDTLVFATDGIGTAFAPLVESLVDPRRLADRILAELAKETDDALVLVARLRGGSA